MNKKKRKITLPELAIKYYSLKRHCRTIHILYIVIALILGTVTVLQYLELQEYKAKESKETPEIALQLPAQEFNAKETKIKEIELPPLPQIESTL